MKTKTTLFKFLKSFFKKLSNKKQSTDNETKETQPSLYTLYRQLYLNPYTTIRSRASDLHISRSKSETFTKLLKNVQRNNRVKK